MSDLFFYIADALGCASQMEELILGASLSASRSNNSFVMCSYFDDHPLLKHLFIAKEINII